MFLFSVKEPEGIRTYYYDADEKYVIVLEPLRCGDAYYLLTAYYIKGKDEKRNKIEKKYKRKLDVIYYNAKNDRYPDLPFFDFLNPNGL